jgi:hypothetical protein
LSCSDYSQCLGGCPDYCIAVASAFCGCIVSLVGTFDEGIEESHKLWRNTKRPGISTIAANFYRRKRSHSISPDLWWHRYCRHSAGDQGREHLVVSMDYHGMILGSWYLNIIIGQSDHQ